MVPAIPWLTSARINYQGMKPGSRCNPYVPLYRLLGGFCVLSSESHFYLRLQHFSYPRSTQTALRHTHYQYILEKSLVFPLVGAGKHQQSTCLILMGVYYSGRAFPSKLSLHYSILKTKCAKKTKLI